MISKTIKFDFDEDTIQVFADGEVFDTIEDCPYTQELIRFLYSRDYVQDGSALVGTENSQNVRILVQELLSAAYRELSLSTHEYVFAVKMLSIFLS